MSGVAPLLRTLAAVWRNGREELGVAVLAIDGDGHALVADRTGAMTWAPVLELDLVDTSIQMIAEEGARAVRAGSKA